MTGEVRFYHNAPDRLRVACSLAAKAAAAGNKVSVFAAQGAVAHQFDQMLWSFQHLAFVPHVAAGSPLAAETPVVIGQDLAALPHQDVLINLDGDLPAGFERFELILEIVGRSDDERQAARARYRAYKAAGHNLTAHDLALLSPS